MNKWEMKNLFRTVKNKINGPVVFLGDFNNGPAVNNVVAELPGMYERAVDNGDKLMKLHRICKILCHTMSDHINKYVLNRYVQVYLKPDHLSKHNF